MQAVLLKHSEIDKAAWDNSLLRSHNSLVYANSSWLDAMCPKWQAIVFGEYEFIMPLPIRQKFGLKYVFTPAFTQQLGLFSTKTIVPEMLQQCMSIVQANFSYAELLFNYANDAQQAAKRNNLILKLNRPVHEIKNDFKSDLRKNLKRAEKFNLSYTQSNQIERAVDLYEQLYGKQMGMTSHDFLSFKTLMKKWVQSEWCFVRNVEAQNGEFLACGVFVNFNKRIYNLASATLPNGRMMEANHWLFYKLVEEFAEKVEVLDFEGSDLPGIARFYQKFGALSQPYSTQTINNLPLILRWLKR